MGTYNDLLNGEFHPPKTWKLVDELTYITDGLDPMMLRDLWALQDPFITINTISNAVSVTAPVDFKTDLGTIPRIVWPIVAPTDIARSATIHDYLYVSIEKYIARGNINHKYIKRVRNAADRVFLNGMLDSDPILPTWKVNLCYFFVRLWGSRFLIGL